MTIQVNSTITFDINANAIIGSGTTRPASPAAGTLWFNTSTGILEGWNGTTWISLTS